jgi:hypothetical protein
MEILLAIKRRKERRKTMEDIYGECGEPDYGCRAHDENGYCAKSEDDPVHQDKTNISYHKFVKSLTS